MPVHVVWITSLIREDIRFQPPVFRIVALSYPLRLIYSYEIQTWFTYQI